MYKTNKIAQVVFRIQATLVNAKRCSLRLRVAAFLFISLVFGCVFPLKAQTETYPRRFILGAGVQFLAVPAPLEDKTKREITPAIGYSVEFGVLSKNKKNALTLAPRFGTVLFKKPVWIVTAQGEIPGTYHYSPGILSIPLNYRSVFAVGKRAGIELGGGVAYNVYTPSMRFEVFTDNGLFATSTITTPFTNHFSFHLLADHVYHFRWKSAVSVGLTAGISIRNEEKYPGLTTPFDYATFGFNTRYLF